MSGSDLLDNLEAGVYTEERELWAAQHRFRASLEEISIPADFERFWNKPNVSQKEFSWVIFGFNPEAVRAYKYTIDVNDNTIEALRFRSRFEMFAHSLQHKFLADYHLALMKLSWDGDKEAFLNKAYTENFDIHPDLCAYLRSIGKMPHNPKLERYTSHSQYKDDLGNWELSKITNEDMALALLLGLNPEFLGRFLALHYRQEKEGRARDNLAPYFRFDPEEKWLFSNYHDFLKKEFPGRTSFGGPLFYIAPRYQKARELNLWGGDFADYVQSLHDNAFVFMPKTYEALKRHGIELSYSVDGWAVKFFQRFPRQPLWNLKDAAKIYLGSDPYGGREFMDFANVNALHDSGAGFALETWETIAEYDNDDNIIPPPEGSIWEEKNSFDTPTSLEGFVRRHLEVGSLVEGKKFEGIERNGDLYFKPEMIVKFFRDYLYRTYAQIQRAV